jgi:hypothetical protein
VTRDDEIFKLRRAWTAGRSSAAGAANAYYGQGIYARAWRLGYQAMLDDMMARAPSRQPFLEAQSKTPQP